MNLVGWNVRGLNDPIKIKEVKNYLQNQKSACCALFETRVRRQTEGLIQKKFGS